LAGEAHTYAMFHICSINITSPSKFAHLITQTLTDETIPISIFTR